MITSPLPVHIDGAPPHMISSPVASRTQSSPWVSPQRPGPSSPRAGSPRTGVLGAIDVESVLHVHGGDVRRALEGMVAERNSLQSQNTQLWKLIERQRTQTAYLTSENERLRLDRERANGRLLGAGLLPVSGKRMPNSSSAVGLGARADVPPLFRRHNSDRDEKMRAPALEIPAASDSSAPSTSGEERPPGLLPSPLPKRKLSRDSRMVFPPEVSSFMTLAELPRDANHSIPPIPVSSSSNTLSPSSQYSASPGTLVKEEAGRVVPPPSSMALAASMEHAGRRGSVPAVPPPPRSASFQSPPLISSATATEPFPRAVPNQTDQAPHSLDLSSPGASEEIDIPRVSLDPRQSGEADRRPSLSSDDVPRLSLALLPHTRLSIPNSSVFPNHVGRDVLCFIIAVTVRPPNARPAQWMIAKLFSAFIDLDTKIKNKAGRGRKEWKAMVAPLPEGRAWKDFAPSKIDQRKASLEAYLQSLLVAPLGDKSDLCEFLSTDPAQSKGSIVKKEGYLTKKGKNFGGWKTRYFVLNGPLLEYYESRGGNRLGAITVTNAQIGRQNRPSESSDDRDFRHAFLIIEMSRKSNIRHVLCADCDEDRDSWIEMLINHVDPDIFPAQTSALTLTPSASSTHHQRQPSAVPHPKRDGPKSSKDFIVTAAQPITNLAGTESKFAGAPSPSMINNMESKRANAASSSASIPSIASSTSQASASSVQRKPSNEHRQTSNLPPSRSNTSLATTSSSGHPITLVTSPSSEILSTSPPVSDPLPRAGIRQSAMSPRPSHSAAYLSKLSSEGINAVPGFNVDKDRDRKAKSGRFWPTFGKAPEKQSRPVFDVPLTDSIAIASVANLPAIVFRCIEWLEAKRAEEEEGIYRLSGSTAVVKGLKDRFDMEGDVNLVAVDENWDPHAIAGLLKTFLRDLPTSLLTRDLHPRFLAVMDLIESSARVAELSRLVSELPPPNYALLRALTAHLILIVRNAASNKMTLRNVGIVFSPTLGIPAGIFSELVTHFGAIFDDADPEDEPDAPEDVQAALTVPSDTIEETVKRKRNSMLYQAGGVDAMLGLSGRALDPANEDSASDVSDDGLESEPPSGPSQEDLTCDLMSPSGGRPSQETVRQARASAQAAQLGLAVEALATGSSGMIRSPVGGGITLSPRPSQRQNTDPIGV